MSGALTWVRQDMRRVIAALVGIVLAVLMLPPLWILLQDSVTTTNAIGDVTGFTAGPFAKLFTDKDALRSIWNSLVFAGGSTVLSLVAGGVLALGLWRRQRRAGQQGGRHCGMSHSHFSPFIQIVLADPGGRSSRNADAATRETMLRCSRAKAHPLAKISSLKRLAARRVFGLPAAASLLSG